MKRIILFSVPLPSVMADLETQLFPKEIENKVLGYMPAEGENEEENKIYVQNWINLAKKHNTEFIYINNSLDSDDEREKLKKINILLVCGGNTCKLLKNIKQNRFFELMKEFLNKEEYIYGGFSAGACLATPTIEIATIEPFNENEGVGLTEFNGLHIVEYEVFPHYHKEYRDVVEKYKSVSKNEIKLLTNEEYLIIEK